MLLKLSAAAAAFATTLLVASTASAALVHDYELNGNLTDSAGGANIVSNGGTLGASGVTFLADQNLAIDGSDNGRAGWLHDRAPASISTLASIT